MTALREVLEQPIAHRGLHDAAHGVIENSASAFAEAIDNDYAIECDLNLSGDDVPMVIHDPNIERVTGQRGNVAMLSAGQLSRIRLQGSNNGDKIMRFAELLEQVDGKVVLAVELKHQDDNRNETLVRETLRILDNYAGPLTFISFSPQISILLRKFGFKGPVGIIIKHFVDEQSKQRLSVLKRFVMRHALHYPKTRFDFVECNHEALGLPAVRLLRTLGIPVVAWTLKSRIDAAAASKHCDQIIFEGYIPRRD